MTNPSRDNACRFWTAVVLLLPLFAAATNAQAGDSEEVGLIRYATGQVLLDGEPVLPVAVGLASVAEEQHLRTGDALAEVALAPGSCLRVGGNTEFEMLSAGATDVRLRLLTGSAVIDVVSKSRKNALSLLYGEAVIGIQKRGLYRIDAVPGAAARLKVFRGQALVSVADSEFTVKGKQTLLLDGTARRAGWFDRSRGDGLDQWSRDRSNELKAAERAAKRPSSGDILRELPTLR